MAIHHNYYSKHTHTFLFFLNCANHKTDLHSTSATHAHGHALDLVIMPTCSSPGTREPVIP